MKKAICVLLVLCMLLPLVGCSGKDLAGAFFLSLVLTSDDSADKADVFDFVREKEEELLKAIEDGDFSAFENQGFIKEINANHRIVDFSCGGAGVGSATSYVGFYFSPDNSLYDAWCAPFPSSELTPRSNGYEWKEPNGDNYYYVEHICGNFYYYEASF